MDHQRFIMETSRRDWRPRGYTRVSEGGGRAPSARFGAAGGPARGDALEQVHVLQHAAEAARRARERLGRDRHGQAGLVVEDLAEPRQQRAAARDDDAALDDVAGELGRRALEARAHRLDDGDDRVAERVRHFRLGQPDGLREAVEDGAALDRHRATVAALSRGSNRQLDRLRLPRADQEVFLFPHPRDDGVVHVVAARPQRLRVDDARQREQRHLGRPATDEHDHVRAGFVDRHAGAERGGERRRDEEDFAGARVRDEVAHRASLDLRRVGGHGDDHARRESRAPRRLHPPEEVREHLLREVGLRDHPVRDRPRDAHRAGLATEHRLRGLPGGEDSAVAEGDDRRLVQHEPAALRHDAGVRGPEVDGELRSQDPSQSRAHSHDNS
jgi:hypothetical protein